MRISELDYELPPSHIAVRPAEPRDQSRLMVVRRNDPGATPEHRRFFNLVEYLRPGDLLITNNTRVLPAKLALRRRTGALIQGLFVSEKAAGVWEVLLRTRGKVGAGEELLGGRFSVLLEERLGEGMWRVRVAPALPAAEILGEIGAIPLPPYIEKERQAAPDPPGTNPEWAARDRDWYQTVFAQGEAHSVAAPTAGLHFTPELLGKIDAMGVIRAQVELEVGPGTFLPVETETLEEHPMHRERYSVPAATIAAIRKQRADGGRIVVVGTTAVRTLETVADEILVTFDSSPTDFKGETMLKIAPGFQFKLTDALITNFHLPRSTLMALVAAYFTRPPAASASTGIDRLRDLYVEAIRENYRFYSYGDAMLILP